jgi:hypothetical protein
MSSHNEHGGQDPRAVNRIEGVLAGFSPTPPQINRDRLMFLAGQASAIGPGFGVQGSGSTQQTAVAASRLRHWLWPASSAAFAAISLALALVLLVRPAPQPTIVYQDRPVPSQIAKAPIAERDGEAISPRLLTTAASLRGDNYIRTREVALRMGVDAIGSPTYAGGGSTAATYGELLLDAAGGRREREPTLPRVEFPFNM